MTEENFYYSVGGFAIGVVFAMIIYYFTVTP